MYHASNTIISACPNTTIRVSCARIDSNPQRPCTRPAQRRLARRSLNVFAMTSNPDGQRTAPGARRRNSHSSCATGLMWRANCGRSR